MQFKNFNIGPEGRIWGTDTYYARLEGGPEKIELIQGKLFGSDDERLNMLAALSEQVGVNQAVQLGDPDVWRQAVAKLA